MMALPSIKSHESLISELPDPITAEDFANEYWGIKPLYIPGWRDKFSSLFDQGRLERCLDRARREEADQAPLRRLSARISYDRGRTHADVSPQDALDHMKPASTLCIGGIECFDEELANFVRRIRAEIGFLGQASIRAYLSTEGDGFALHFDGRVATTLQLEGQKRWRYSNEAALDWPHYQVGAGMNAGRVLQSWEQFRAPETCTFQEVVLNPGDVLCLPAGVWHSAEAVGSSFALNLAFDGPGQYWSSVLVPLLSASAILRTPPPLTPGVSITDSAVPVAIDEFLQGGLKELADAIASLQEDPAPLREMWRTVRGQL